MSLMSNSRHTENYIQKALQEGFEITWVYEMLEENYERTEYRAFTENCPAQKKCNAKKKKIMLNSW